MSYTDEYRLGWGAWAENFGFSTSRHGCYSSYALPGTWKNGWISEMNPTDGLFAASAWFTTDKKLDYTIHTGQPYLWVFCVDCGKITFTQRGKPAKELMPFTQLIISDGKPLRMVIPAQTHTCFTSVLIFDSCIENFLKANKFSYPIRVRDAKKWKPGHVDSPNVMLVMEQIRWGVRGNRLPVPVYLCKAIELISLFAHNMEREKHKRVRRHYVTWNDEMKLYRVKERIDKNPLDPPSTEELCCLAEMSESKLRIAFKSLYNMTLYAYIREAVMKRAMQMLANDELNIKNIATRCGYENPAKFAAAFKDIHGITPSAFRKTFGL